MLPISPKAPEMLGDRVKTPGPVVYGGMVVSALFSPPRRFDMTQGQASSHATSPPINRGSQPSPSRPIFHRRAQPASARVDHRAARLPASFSLSDAID